MSNSEDHIEAYFQGELSPEEKEAFESRCLSDPDLAKEVALYIMVHDHLNEQWFRLKMQEFAGYPEPDSSVDPDVLSHIGDVPVNTSYPQEGTGQAPVIEPSPGEPLKNGNLRLMKIKTWRRFAVAAAVLAVIALGVTWYVQNRKENRPFIAATRETDSPKITNVPNTTTLQGIISGDSSARQEEQKKKMTTRWIDITEQQRLADNNFKVDNPPGETGGLLAEAFNQYKDGHYAKASGEYEDAIATIDNLSLRSGEDKQDREERKKLLFYAHYYNALSRMADGKVETAISALRKIKESPDLFWQSKVQWYLALAYLKKGDAEKAAPLLQQVAGNRQAGEYQSKAVALSREIVNN